METKSLNDFLNDTLVNLKKSINEYQASYNVGKELNERNPAQFPTSNLETLSERLGSFIWEREQLIMAIHQSTADQLRIRTLETTIAEIQELAKQGKLSNIETVCFLALKKDEEKE